MASATTVLEGGATAPQRIIATYNTATLACSQIQVVNAGDQSWYVELDNTTTVPTTVFSQVVVPATNHTFAVSGVTLRSVTGDDGGTAIELPAGWTIYARYPA